ncbi:MAG: single-stranded nucleic acid binding protein [Acidobacteriaceae bacterium]|nr:single-stranded nucleic acid binding protein [Acidobacteriaceae bacterium]
MPMLTERNGELLNAFEHVTAKVLGLEPEEHDRISFDADSFKANRDRDLRVSATKAIATVRESNRPFSFPPMTSRERRLLHLVLSESGLPTASSGDGPRRFVVLYPEGQGAAEVAYAATGSRTGRADAIRSSFRRR